MTWAPNAVIGQHDISALKLVVDSLKEIEEFADYDDIVELLRDLGKIASGK